jgi:hypothetical protein
VIEEAGGSGSISARTGTANVAALQAALSKEQQQQQQQQQQQDSVFVTQSATADQELVQEEEQEESIPLSALCAEEVHSINHCVTLL